MFARILDFEVKMEKKEEFVKVMKNQVLPTLKKQTGFLDNQTGCRPLCERVLWNNL
jgi:hypothetical protein